MGKPLDISAYLESGILELYVSGTLPDAEAQEVTALMREHPEIQAEVEKIEQTMLGYFEAHAPENDSGHDALNLALAHIASSSAPVEENIRPLTPEPSKRFNWRWLAVAASVLLLASIGLNWLLYQRWQGSEYDLQSLISERNQLALEQENLRTSLGQKDALLAHVNDPSSQRIDISAAPLEKEGEATLIWNEETDQVLLASYVLPEPPEGKQYQLWALYGDQPVSLGVFDQDSIADFMLAAADQPTAFAISLEKMGGNPTPTEVWAVGAVPG